MKTTLLITLAGSDRPGVTARLFGVLAPHRLTVLDIEQVVIRGKLVLGVLLAPQGASLDLTGIHEAVSGLADELGLVAEITAGPGGPGTGTGRGRLHVTLLGSPLTPGAIGRDRRADSTAGGANIDRISRLASDPVTCIEFDVFRSGDLEVLRADLATEAAALITVWMSRWSARRTAPAGDAADRDGRGLPPRIQDEVIELQVGRDQAHCAAQVGEGNRGGHARRTGLPRLRCTNGSRCSPGLIRVRARRCAGPAGS